MATCNAVSERGYRRFWATKPANCGTYPGGCDGRSECGVPGLQLDTKPGGKTINTDDYVAGLALNILGTDASADATACGVRPGARGGYWADAFRSDGYKTGTRLRALPSAGRIQDLVSLAEAYAKSDLQKLVSPYGVASKVTVTAAYVGGNSISVQAEIYGTDGRTSKVNISGSRIKNSWVWA